MPAKLERCVKQVERKGGVDNAWAVCQASLYGHKRNPSFAVVNESGEYFAGFQSGEPLFVKDIDNAVLWENRDHAEAQALLLFRSGSPVRKTPVRRNPAGNPARYRVTAFSKDKRNHWFSEGTHTFSDESAAKKYYWDLVGQDIYGVVWVENDSKIVRYHEMTLRQAKQYGVPGRRINPADTSAAMYESFHGKPSTETVEVEESEHYHGNLAELGVLVEMGIETVTGKEVWLSFGSGEGESETADNPYTLTDGAKKKAKEKGKLLVKTSSHRQYEKMMKLTGFEWYGPVSLGSKQKLVLVDDTPTNRSQVDQYAQLMKTNPMWPFGPGQPLGSREYVYHVGGKRKTGHTSTLARGIQTTRYKGYSIEKHGAGDFVVPKLDPASHWDSLKFAKQAVDQFGIHFRKNSGDTYTDLAYGSQFFKKGNQWFYKLSFRAPGGPTRRLKADKEMVAAIERMIKSGKIVKQNPGPIASATKFAGDVTGINFAARKFGQMTGSLDKRLGKAIGFTGNPGIDDDPARLALYRRAQAADDAYQEALEKEYGKKRASDMRYKPGPHESAHVEKLRQAKRLADEKWRAAVDEHRQKSNPSADAISTSTVLLCSNESGTQLFFVGGDQSIDIDNDKLKFSDDEKSKELILLGTCFFISYFTQKDFDHFEPIVYEHDLGEETGVMPSLVYDRINKRLSLVGGDYRIQQPMLETSPGIEN